MRFGPIFDLISIETIHRDGDRMEPRASFSEAF